MRLCERLIGFDTICGPIEEQFPLTPDIMAFVKRLVFQPEQGNVSPFMSLNFEIWKSALVKMTGIVSSRINGGLFDI